MMYETENIEFKEKYSASLLKEIIAFANTDGGTIYVGIDDNGETVGLENIDQDFAQITNEIRDAIAPDVTMFVKCIFQDSKVLEIKISEGSNKPYYLRSKGLKPSGVYVRQGSSSAQASPEQIRQLIKASDGDNFESMRSIEQQLSFTVAKDTFEKYNIEFSKTKYPILGITKGNDDIFTNLAFLLSDQCSFSTKVAVYSNNDNTVLNDSREFKGSVFAQLNNTFEYLNLINQTSVEFKGLERIEKKDYPEVAIREALLNAIVHRDYSFSGSIIINVNKQQIEFISIGGLLPGLTLEDITSGISQPRNNHLADIFFRLHLIESYGTGLRKIISLYNGLDNQPTIKVTPNTFKITLPNMNTNSDKERKEKEATPKMTPQKEKIANFLTKYTSITDAQVEELLKIKKTRAFVIMKQMRDEGIVEAVGRGSDKRYVLRAK